VETNIANFSSKSQYGYPVAPPFQQDSIGDILFASAHDIEHANNEQEELQDARYSHIPGYNQQFVCTLTECLVLSPVI
jgi:hypothetical protein